MQQVNLYLPEFQPNREPLQALHMVVITVGLLVVMVLASGIGVWQNQHQQARLAQSQQALETLRGEVQVLRAKQPKSKQAQLDREIARLEKEVGRRQQILELIAEQNLGNSAGFSRQLEGMARQHINTLSIDRFGLKQGGSYVEFSGWTRKADQVPLFLQRLRQEESFQQVGFGVLKIERSKTRRDAMQFSIARPEDAS